ncbi:MAG: 30S ribosomal protein S7 [Victivallales bacterium]|nr:30S ribosomal protein S7 [Victivallales bacterium]
MRRRKAEKRQVIPDIRFNSEIVARLINVVMERGKKSTAQTIVYDAFDIIKQSNNDADPLEIFNTAMENVKPKLEVKSRRVGGATYQVPLDVPAERQVAVALRWIVSYARARKGIPMAKALANELMDAFNNTGNAVKKKEDVHKMAKANQAFAHFRY